MTFLWPLKTKYESQNISIAVVGNCIIVYVILKSYKHIERLLGKQRIAVIRKIFGVILLARAVKFFAANIQNLF